MLALAAALPFAATGAGGAARGERYAVRAESHLVLIPITVTDRNGKAITDLQPEHFRVHDESEPRPVLSVVREEAPVSMGIVMDLSGSMADKIPQTVGAVRAITDIAEEGDEGFLITFSDRPVLRTPLTGDVKSLASGMAFVKVDGATALVDAIYMGLHESRRSRNPRKALVVVSDGGDNNSRYSESELVSRALESDVQIYSIGIAENLRSREERSGAYLLEKLSAVTGGLHFTIRNPKELPAVAEKIAQAMKSLYVLSYKPPESLQPGKWRKVRVSLAVASPRSFRVVAKSGYFSPE
jgi:Ca-activated chloride channel family protein